MNDISEHSGMIPAILIIGTSNSGKSPLGEYLQEHFSAPGKRFFHFDFGGQLRRVLDVPGYAGVSADENAYVRSVMKGQLIDASHFPVAGKILTHFVAANGFVPEHDMLVLNGFPRSVVQADFLEDLDVIVKKLVYLDCPASVALARKKNAERGLGFEDRSIRPDKEMEIFIRKVASFESETFPLKKYFRKKGAEIITVKVGKHTSPQEMVAGMHLSLII
jgi:adenylate kinase family enzyme